MDSLLWSTMIWHTRRGTMEQNKRGSCHFTMQAQTTSSFNKLCFPWWPFARRFGRTVRGGLVPLSQNRMQVCVWFMLLVRGDRRPVNLSTPLSITPPFHHVFVWQPFFSFLLVQCLVGQDSLSQGHRGWQWSDTIWQAPWLQKHWWVFVSRRCQDPRTVSLCEIKRVCKSIWMTSHGKCTEVSIKGVWEMNRTCCMPLRE